MSPQANAKTAKPKPAKGSKALGARVKKAAPKKGKKKKAKEAVEITTELLRQNALFKVLPDDLLAAICPRAKHLDLDRDEHLCEGSPQSGSESAVFFVLYGDVSIHRTDDAGRESVVNFLSVDEVFLQKIFQAEDTKAMRVTAMCLVKAIRLDYGDVNVLLKESPAFREAFSTVIQTVTQRQHSRFDSRFQKDVARFLVQQRLTFAGRVKIKRMDLCIECDGCYDACSVRHGTDRLGASEVKYGLTEILQNCHNCVVPECIDKCKFGHITRDTHTNEIIIDDNCVGCTLCSKGCSFGSIRMHPIAELDLPKYFPNRKPDARGKTIAQKCDNCTGHEDMACISACPTGALFQVDGRDLFTSWQQFTVHEHPGFEDVETPEAVPRKWRVFWVIFTVLNTLFLAWECFGRLYWPEFTFTETLFLLGLTDSGVDRDVPFKAGDFFSHALGYIGGSMLLATQVYRMRKKWGRTRVLMEAHIWTGVLGGIYGLFHTTFVFNDPIAIATFGTMVLAILTGVVGRYLVYMVPRTQAGTQMALDELKGEIDRLNREIEAQFRDARDGRTALIRVSALMEKAQEDEQDTDEATDAMSWKHLSQRVVNLFHNARADRDHVRDMVKDLSVAVHSGNSATVSNLLQEKVKLERSIRQYNLLSVVLKRYRVIHVTSSNIMFGALLRGGSGRSDRQTHFISGSLHRLRRPG